MRRLQPAQRKTSEAPQTSLASSVGFAPLRGAASLPGETLTHLSAFEPVKLASGTVVSLGAPLYARFAHG